MGTDTDERAKAVLPLLAELQSYRELLRQSFRAENLEAVMCRSLISVNWQGRLFDCDFNQQLGIACGGNVQTLEDLLSIPAQELEHQAITVAEHCFGCTAGSGSSCGGALNGGSNTT